MEKKRKDCKNYEYLANFIFEIFIYILKLFIIFLF